jgi:hypothetical protein
MAFSGSCRMSTAVAMSVPDNKSLVASVRAEIEGAWDALARITSDAFGAMPLETRLASAAGAGLLVGGLFWWWRRRVGAAKRVQAASHVLYPPPPSTPPPRPETMVFKLERRRGRDPEPRFLLPNRDPEVPPAHLPDAEIDTVPARIELSAGLLRQLEWKRFELIVQRFFGASGLRAESTGVGANGGVDIYLHRGDEPQPFKYVQCCACDLRAVGLESVATLHGLLVAAKVEGGFVTTGVFTPSAQAFAHTNGIDLLTGEVFVTRFNALPDGVRHEILDEVLAGDYTTPSCRRCDLKLVLESEQAMFWRCPRAPRCTYVLPVGRGGGTTSPLVIGLERRSRDSR